MTTTVLGKVMLLPRGDYSPSATYNFLDLVTYEGSSFVALKTVTGVTPIDDGVSYQLSASKGEDTSIYGLDTGTANAYAATFAPAVTALTDGLAVRFKAANANTGASTFAPNGLPAKAVLGGAQVPLQGGEIIADGQVGMVYNATLDAWTIDAQSGGALQIADATQSAHAVSRGQLSQNNGSTLVGFLQAGTGAMAQTVDEVLQLTKHVESFGGGVGIDNTAAINAAQAAGVTRLLFDSGTYLVNGAANVYGMTLEGKGASTVLDCSASTALYPLTAQGSLTALPALGADPVYGGNQLTFASAPALSPGSVLIIYNPTDYSFSGFRNYYYAGEFCEAFEIVGNVVSVKGNLYAGYTAASVACYSVGSAPSGLSKMTIKGGTSSTGIYLASCLIAPLFDQVTVIAANVSGICLDRCFKGKVLASDTDNLATGATTDPYCIVISNSQHTQITGGVHFSPWQPIVFGGLSATGAVPTRDATINGAVIRNDPSQGVPAADCHGNCQDIRYVNCTIYGGVTFSGAGISYDDCAIYGSTNAPQGWVCDSAEMLGGTYSIKGGRLECYIDPGAVSARGVIDVGGNSTAITSSTVQDCNFIIRPSVVKLNAVSSVTELVKIVNRGAAVNINVTVEGFQLITPSAHYILSMSNVSGTAMSTGIAVDKIQGMPSGMRLASLTDAYLTSPLRMQKQNGMVAGTTTASTSFISGVITLPYVYPREPRVSVSITGSAGASLGLVGGQITSLQSYATSATTVRPAFYSPAAMTAGTNFELHWGTELAEC